MEVEVVVPLICTHIFSGIYNLLFLSNVQFFHCEFNCVS